MRALQGTTQPVATDPTISATPRAVQTKLVSDVLFNTTGVNVVTGLPTIDMLGLTDPVIAHTPIRGPFRFPGHAKGNGASVLDRKPGLILMGGVSLGPEPESRLRTELASEDEIAADPRFASEYVREEVPVDQREHGLRLGVAEADVELDDAQPLRRQCQTAVEEPGERGAAVGHFFQHRPSDLLHDVVGKVFGKPFERRIGAHTPGVGALVIVEYTFEVLGGLERVDGAPVGDGEQ